MKNSKLASLLSKLDKNEFKEFGKFVKSPYFNSNAKVVKLYELIAKHFPEFESAKLSKENIYKHIYPSEKYNDSTVRGLLASMLKLGEEFLVVSHFKVEKHYYDEFLLSELADRRIFDLFNINYKKITEELENSNSKDEEYYYLKFRIETKRNSILSKTFIPLTQKDIPGDMRTEDSDALINFFLISLYKRYNYLLTKMGSLNVSAEMDFLNETLDYLGRKDLKKIPTLNFHYNRAMLYLSGMDEKYFLKLKDILFNDFNSLDHTERYNIMAVLQNYCVQKARDKEDAMGQIQYELYNFAIEKDILTFDNVEPVHHILFSNIVTAMLFVNKIDEAKNFIKKFKTRVAPDRMESAENLNMAKICFKEKKYEDALTLLVKVRHEDVFYKIGIKNLYAMIYYEMNYIEELFMQLDSYKSFISSNVLLGKRLKESHSNFVNFLLKLVKLKDIGKKDDIEYLEHEIKKTYSLTGKAWLLKKIDELK